MNTLWKHPLETMWQLETIRLNARVRRFRTRLRSPRQAITSILAIVFVGLYLLAGFTVFSKREPVDPQRLQTWLSGGMVLYAIYHWIKYLWSARRDDSPSCVLSTPAMALWLSGGPLPRAAIVLHEVARVIPATAAKSFLLCVVLGGDVGNVLTLATGVFLALFTLEAIRRLVSHVIDAMAAREKTVLKVTSLLVGIALVAQLGLQSVNETPSGSDPARYMTAAIAEVALLASSDAVQWLALPLQPASHLAVGRPMWPIHFAGFELRGTEHGMLIHVGLLITLSLAIIAALAYCLVRLDAWAIDRRHAEERRQLPQHRRTAKAFSSETCPRDRLITASRSNRPPTPLRAIVGRQWHCIRRYGMNVLISFAIPMIVSLSPLFTNAEGLAGQATKQWVFVIGGIALSSLLLAPPALQIDFRRDLKRMRLLKSFPVSSSAMCVGMLSVPVVITILFQWATLAIATVIAAPPGLQIGWLAIAFPALAVLTFAVENALFLAFPHQIHDQGIAMVIRAKLTFLWKGLVLAMAPVALFLCFSICHTILPPSFAFPASFVASLLGSWFLALAAFTILVGCWNRFDPAIDTPPE